MSTAPARIFWLPWLVLAAAAVGILYAMVGYWVRGYDTFDRGIILIASAWLVWHRWPKLVTLPDTPWPVLGTILVVIGAVLFLPPWFVYSQIGPRPVILWWLASALFLATTGLILIRSGPNLFTAVRFCLIFPLFALPLPGRIQNPIQEFLQGFSTSIAVEVIPLFGVPVLDRAGFMLRLPSGGINVVEACSGLTQVRAILSVAAFIAHIRGFGVVRGPLTLLISLPIIVIVNSIRVVASGLFQEWWGPDAITGWKHEALGLALFLIGLTLVLGVTRLMMRPGDTAAFDFTGPQPSPSRGASVFATAVLLAALAAGIACLYAPGVGRSVGDEPPFDQIPTQLGPWKMVPYQDPRNPDAGPNMPIEDEVKVKLTYNNAIHRVYEAKSGEKAHVWCLHWKSAMVVKDYHHPDICNLTHGDVMVAKDLINLRTPAGRVIPLTYREFTREGMNKLIVYWTQEGRRVWTEADEVRCASFAFPLLWMRERLQSGRDPDDCDDRLVIYVGLPLFKHRGVAVQRERLIDLAGRVADEVYRLCPWAEPKKP